jgi:hypothetical protein
MEYYPHQKVFVSLDPEGFRIFWIQKVFVSLDLEGFRILYLPAKLTSRFLPAKLKSRFLFTII